MSLNIEGMMNSPLVSKLPVFTSGQRRVNVEVQEIITDNNYTAANKPNSTQIKCADDHLKRYSDCISNYAKAEISIQSGSNSGIIGTETTGTIG